MIATISEAGGVELVRSYTRAIVAGDFIAYLKLLRRKYGNTPIALYLDQLQVHKARDVRPWYRQLDIMPILNVGYSPELNAIEAVFSKVKAQFNRNRLNCLVNKTGFNVEREIRAAFAAITAKHCAACVRKSLYILDRYVN